MERPYRKTKLVSTVWGAEQAKQINLLSESVMYINAQVERVDVS